MSHVIDREKRERVFRRSVAIGHCVCNPRRPCPCDIFKAHNVCECAGERMVTQQHGPVRLTETVRNAGCASKIPKRDLEAVLKTLPILDDPRVLVGAAAGDDAGVVQLGSGPATVLTVDVFTPSVDDPYTFGQVAAANSVSDIYAMGATPQAALSIIGFPSQQLPLSVMEQILRGGIDKMGEAGVAVVGGHSLNDDEVKFGFAVVGAAPAEGSIVHSKAQPGDHLVLTKALGGGIISFALQCGLASAQASAAAARSMTALNKVAGLEMHRYGATAATDITGFGLLGHLVEIARKSQVAIELDFDALPLLPTVPELVRRGIVPGAAERNREAVDSELLDLSALAAAQQEILFGPETSGGLLVCLPESRARDYVERLRAEGIAEAALVGRVLGSSARGAIRVLTHRAAEFEPIRLARSHETTGLKPGPAEVATPDACCGNGAHSGAVPASGPNASGAFGQYMKMISGPGALEVKFKKLISLALSVATRCEPCIRINREAARGEGASEQEIEEAMALGVAFGGAPASMMLTQLRG